MTAPRSPCPVGRGPIFATSSGGIPDGDELGQLGLLFVQNPQGPVFGPGELPGFVGHPLQKLVEIQVRGHGQPGGMKIVKALDLLFPLPPQKLQLLGPGPFRLVVPGVFHGQSRLGGKGREQFGIGLGKGVPVLRTPCRPAFPERPLVPFRRAMMARSMGTGRAAAMSPAGPAGTSLSTTGSALGEGPGAEALFRGEGVVEGGDEGPGAGIEEELTLPPPGTR